MRNNQATNEFSGAELLSWEKALAAELRNFVNFRNCELYFPHRRSICNTILLTNERLLLLPLILGGKTQAMLRLEGVEPLELEPILPILPKIASLVLEKRLLERAVIQDARSSLFSEDHLFGLMEENFEKVREQVINQQPGARPVVPWHRLCMIFVIIRWLDGNKVARKYDREFYQKVYLALTSLIKENLEDYLAIAPIGRYEGSHDIGVIFNSASKGLIVRQLESLLAKIDRLSLVDSVSKESYRPEILAGYSLYPQDMPGESLALPFFDQIVRLKKNAQLAASVLARLRNEGVRSRVMAYKGIAQNTGKITGIISPAKVRVNLGKNANVRPGMRFFIQEKGSIFERARVKGQLMILESFENESLAEIYYLNSPQNIAAIGDKLLQMGALNDAESSTLTLFSPQQNARASFISSHAEFNYLYQHKIKDSGKFYLAIIRLNAGKELDENANREKWADVLVGNGAGEKEMPNNCLAGYYGHDRVIMAFFEQDLERVRAYLFECARRAKDASMFFACGIAFWPYLDFSQNETELNTLKALEYAELLPEPHIGIFDSMAQTISADKKYSLGDILGAIEDYKLALLADETNAIARNSLGVCLASLGKYAEARKNLKQSLESADNNELRARIAYNLGTVYQNEGKAPEAAYWYRQCLRFNKLHPYAWMRMGKISEAKNRVGSAKRYYLCALRLAKDDIEIINLAERYLAGLAMANESAKLATAHLHDNLLRNPLDTASMEALARVYLTLWPDPAIAEMLARKSIRLTDSAAAWLLLAQALEQQGRMTDAAKARERAEKKS